MTEVRIRCIKKDGGNHNNPHEGITHYGWINPISNNSDLANRITMVSWLEKNGNYAYVKDQFGNKAYCKIVPGKNGKFLQTIADGRVTDNLLNLPEC
jgi:hypothetical protein